MMEQKIIIISIVSHRNISEIFNFLEQNVDHLDLSEVLIIIRVNINENTDIMRSLLYSAASIKIVINEKPLGFGANHNKTFNWVKEKCDIFIVCNPDIGRISGGILDEILSVNSVNPKAILTPRIVTKNLTDVDYIRNDIRLLDLIRRLFNKAVGTGNRSRFWFPSVFKCFPKGTFEHLQGYDPRIFMYYEDYDICMRARKLAYPLTVVDKAFVVHEGTRKSRKNLQLFMHHIRSIGYVYIRKLMGGYK